MVKKARNIYDYYREQEIGDSDRERVNPLENNTTKALINTLENCSPELTHRLFSTDNLNISFNGKELNYHLQTKPATISEKLDEKNKEAYVIGISEDGEIDRKSENISSSERDSIPDALIFDDNVLIAIEVKTGDDKLKREQLNNHLSRCEDQLADFKSYKKTLRWDQIAEFLSEYGESNQIIDKKEFFLIGQLLEYLKVNNMTKFKNFEREWLTSKGRPKSLKKQLFNLTERLQKNLPDEYGLSHTSSDDNRNLDTWDYLSYGNVKNDKTIPHITLTVQPSEFHIKIHIQGDPNKDKHMKYLYNLSNQELNSFIDHLRRIYNSFSENEFKNKDKIPGWYHQDHKPMNQCVRPIWLKLDGRKGGAPQGSSGLLSKYRARRKLGIIYEKDLKKVKDFMKNEFKNEHSTQFNFQIILRYPYSECIGLLTGDAGRDFYEEAKKDVNILYPLFKDIKEKSI